jgi:hypothetical protein
LVTVKLDAAEREEGEEENKKGPVIYRMRL